MFLIKRVAADDFYLKSQRWELLVLKNTDIRRKTENFSIINLNNIRILKALRKGDFNKELSKPNKIRIKKDDK